MTLARATCFALLRSTVFCALSLALDNAGNKSPAKMAMMAMTTNSSIKVNARRRVSFLSQASDFTILIFLINALGCSRNRRLYWALSRRLASANGRVNCAFRGTLLHSTLGLGTLKRQLQRASRTILVGVQPSGCPWRAPAGESSA